MSVKSGAFLSVGRNFIIDRLQTSGVSNFNLPKTKIDEVGNWNSVQTIYDSPDLTYDLETLDVSCEIEALLTGVNSQSITAHQEFDFNNAVPFDMTIPLKSRTGQYDTVGGIIVPYLYLDRVTYRAGLNQNCTAQYSLRGDGAVSTQGTPYYQEFTYTGAATYSFAHTASVYTEQGDTLYAVSVMLRDSGSSAYKRLFFGSDADYTNTSSGFTVTASAAALYPTGTYDTVCVSYSSTVSTLFPQALHQGVSVKPAAVRSRDIDVLIGSSAATPVYTRLPSVQAFEVSRSVTLQKDEEFGNSHVVDQDFDTPTVSGSVTVKPRDPAALFAVLQSVTGVTDPTIGALTTISVPLQIRINHPDTGARVKTILVSDARFTFPPISARVNQKLEFPLNFDSDTGSLIVVNGTHIPS